MTLLHLRIFNSIKASKNGIFCKQLTPSFFLHTQAIIKKEDVEHDKKESQLEKQYSPAELLRRNAYRVESAAALRSRCRWTQEESEKLLKLIDVMGKRWTAISHHFIDRSPSNVMNHYYLLTDKYSRGAWSEEELKKLKELGRGRAMEEIDDWENIQAQLPTHRPLFLIRQCYQHSLDPRIKHGRWSEKESERLRELVMKFGEDNMAKVAQFMGTRTKRQCLERWRWQMGSMKKGRFSPEEDRLILDAVQKYGENFAVICKVTGIQRTARHVSQHYNTILNPQLDRTPWTKEEEELVYKTCLECNKDMLKTREVLKSNRAIRDLWNHFYKQERKMNPDKV